MWATTLIVLFLSLLFVMRVLPSIAFVFPISSQVPTPPMMHSMALINMHRLSSLDMDPRQTTTSLTLPPRMLLCLLLRLVLSYLLLFPLLHLTLRVFPLVVLYQYTIAHQLVMYMARTPSFNPLQKMHVLIFHIIPHKMFMLDMIRGRPRHR